jgi:hypothetical protein
MVKKIIKTFLIPTFLFLLFVVINFYIEQTTFTWIIEKIVIAFAIISYLIAFPFFLISEKEKLSIKESFSKTIKKIISFWYSVVILLSFFLGVFLLSLLIFSSLGTFLFPGINYVLLFLLSFIIFAILAIGISVKFSLAPFLVLFEETKGIHSFWESGKRKFSKWKTFIGLVSILFLSIFLSIGASILINNLLFLVIINTVIPIVFFVTITVFLFRKYEHSVSEKNEDYRLITKCLYFIPKIAGGVFIFLIAITSFNVFFRDYDSYVFDDSDLIIEETKVAEEDNLFYFLASEEFKNCLDNVIDPVIEIKNYHDKEYSNFIFIKENFEEAERIVKENEVTYSCFDKMRSYDYYVSPLRSPLAVENRETIIIPGNVFSISRANILRANYLSYIGEEEEALKVILGGMRIANMMAKNPNGDFLSSLIGIGVFINYTDFNFKIGLDKNNTKDLIEEITSYGITESDFNRVIKGLYTTDVVLTQEYFFSLKEENQILIEKPSFFYKPKKTRMELANFYRLMLSDDFDSEELERYYFSRDYFNAYFEDIFIRDNFVGNILKYSIIPAINIEKQREQYKNINLTNRLIVLVLAINSYEKENEKLPEDLDDLVPDYISEVPLDPLTGKEIVYSPEKRIIYSKEIENDKDDYHYSMEF